MSLINVFYRSLALLKEQLMPSNHILLSPCSDTFLWLYSGVPGPFHGNKSVPCKHAVTFTQKNWSQSTIQALKVQLTLLCFGLRNRTGSSCLAIEKDFAKALDKNPGTLTDLPPASEHGFDNSFILHCYLRVIHLALMCYVLYPILWH